MTDRLPSRPTPPHQRSFRFGMVLLVSLALLIIGWSATRGFDFTDEGVYYLSYSHPKDITLYTTSDYLYGGIVYAAMGQDIVTMRLLTFAAYFAAICIFTLGVYRYGRSANWGIADDYGYVGLALAGVLFTLPVSYLPMALVYNQINGCALLCGVGLFLLGLHYRDQESARRCVALFGAGLSVGIALFAKVSSGLAALCAYALILCLAQKIGWRNKFVGFGAFCLGVIVWLAIHFLLISDFHEWIGVFGAALIASRKSETYGSPTHMLMRYAGEIWIQLRAALSIAGVALAFATLSTLVSLRIKRFADSPLAQWGVLIVTIGLLLGVVYLEGGFKGGQSGWFLIVPTLVGFWVVLAPAWIAHTSLHLRSENTNPRKCVEDFAIVGLLAMTPFLGAVGTGNHIGMNALFQLGAWASLTGLIGSQYARFWRNSNLARAALLTAGLVVFVQFVHGRLYDPYRLRGSLFEQTIPVSIGGSQHTLKVDAATAKFLDESRKTLSECGFRVGEDLVALFDMPGLVFALGGRSPGHPWLFSYTPQFNLERLKSVEYARLRGAFVAVRGSHPEAAALLQSAGLDFPKDYVLCGATTATIRVREEEEKVKYWRPRLRSTGQDS